MLSMKLVFSNQHVSLQLFTSGPTCAYKQKYIFIMAEHDALLLELRAKQNLFFCLSVWKHGVPSGHHMQHGAACAGAWTAAGESVAGGGSPRLVPQLLAPHHSPTTTTLPSPSCHQLPLLLALALQPATSIQSWSSFYQFHPRIAPFGGDIYFIACK